MKEQLYRVSEAAEFPSTLFGASRVELQGNHQALLIGHKGIRSYGDKEMIVDMADCALRLCGEGLSIAAMTKQELLIRGMIVCLSYEK